MSEPCFLKKLTAGLGPENQEVSLDLLNYTDTTLWSLIILLFLLIIKI